MTFVIINAQIIVICFTFIRNVIIRRKFWNLIKTFHKIISESSWELIDPLLCLFSISFWYCHIQCDIRTWGAYAEILEGRGEIQKLGQKYLLSFSKTRFLEIENFTIWSESVIEISCQLFQYLIWNKIIIWPSWPRNNSGFCLKIW